MTLSILQVVLALGLLNVWLLRFRQSTPYRGGGARSMPEEFAVYGLPLWFAYVVGLLKVGAAVCLIVGLWERSLVFPAAAVICVLMLGALAMHAKVHDALTKSLPALAVLAIAAILCFGSIR